MRSDQLEHRAVAVEVAVPALGFMRWIAHVVAVTVYEAIICVRGARLAIPGPEIGTADRSIVRHARLHGAVDHAVVPLSEAGADARVIALTITRKAEFFEDQWLAQRPWRFVRGSSGTRRSVSFRCPRFLIDLCHLPNPS